MSDDMRVIIENENGRDAFLDFAQRHLPKDEAIVKLRDLVGLRRSFRTRLVDTSAVLVATEPPLVLRGSLTALVSYYRVKADKIEARETHYDGESVSHAYDVLAPIARLGAKVMQVRA